MIYLLLILLIITFFFPYSYISIPWFVLIILYFINKENVRTRQERIMFNKLEIALNRPNKPIIV